ncbi:MAG: hypothetical protein ABI543_04210 [Ignavibacteria bacterium]
MKTAIITLFLIHFSVFSQTDEKSINDLNLFAESINTLINNSSGAPGEIYKNTVNVQRNVRAIGMQDTRITFYYFQKDDSVYMDSEDAVQFIPQYNPPLMVMVEYNIGSSQTVVARYYVNGDSYLYNFISTGAYGNMNRTYWFDKNDLKRFEERSARDEMGVIIEAGTFSKSTYSDGLLVLDKIADYKKLYYEIFDIEYKDK